jgi:ABC-type amino acid transport substrate-binding protein
MLYQEKNNHKSGMPVKEWRWGKFVPAILILSFFSLSQTVRAQGNINSQQFSLIIGVAEYSPPISYDLSGVFAGYCADLIKELQDKKGYKIQTKFIKLDKRFEGKAKDQDTGQEVFLDAECGPNTIDFAREVRLSTVEGKFSEPFAWTPYSFLKRKGSIFDKEKAVFGVLGKETLDSTNTTTTHIWLQNIGVKKIVLLKDRNAVFEAIEKSSIEWYVNDEILLMGLMTGATGKIVKKDYEIDDTPSTPDRNFQNRYGLVVYKYKSQNSQLLSDINLLIKNSTDLKVGHTIIRKLSASNSIDIFVKEWEDSAPVLPSGEKIVTNNSSSSDGSKESAKSFDTKGSDTIFLSVIFLSLIGLFSLVLLLAFFFRAKPDFIHKETHKNKVSGKNHTVNQGGNENENRKR